MHLLQGIRDEGNTKQGPNGASSSNERASVNLGESQNVNPIKVGGGVCVYRTVCMCVCV